MKTAKEIVDFILTKDLRLKFLEDQILDLEGDAKHEAIDFLGNFELVDWDERKDGRSCVETAVIHFTNYELYIEEIAFGPCHYRDVMIDGWPDEINYNTVEPIVTTAYGNRTKI